MSCCGGKCYCNEHNSSPGLIRHYDAIGLKLRVRNGKGNIKNVFLFGSGTHFGLDLRPSEHYYSVIQYGPHRGGVEVISTNDTSSEVIVEASGVPYIYLVDYLLENKIKVNRIEIQFVIKGKTLCQSDIDCIKSSTYLKLWKVELFKKSIDLPIYLFDYVKFDEPDSVYFATSGVYFDLEKGALLELGLPVIDEEYNINMIFETDSINF